MHVTLRLLNPKNYINAQFAPINAKINFASTSIAWIKLISGIGFYSTITAKP